MSAGSPQEAWLKADLAAHPKACVLAYWHEPRFTSGTEHFSNSDFDPFWRDLYAAGADIVLNGHVHNYERFARQNPNGQADAKGIREFVVGTGGVSHYTSGSAIANSQVQNDSTFGVLKLTLHSGSYDWRFVPVAGGTFTDSGSNTCSGAAPAPAAGTSSKPAPRYRYIYNSGSDQAGAAANGWNLLDAGSKSTADALPAGTKGLVWLGDYDNQTCGWEMSDADVTTEVASAIGDPKVAGYFFSDEPDPNACANAVADHKARSGLIHSLDPSKFTVMVADMNSGGVSLAQIPLWKGAADYIGLDPYPCRPGEACKYSWIRQVIAAADASRAFLLGRRAGVQRQQLALADAGRGGPHAHAVGPLEAARLHGLRVDMARQRPHEPAETPSRPAPVQQGGPAQHGDHGRTAPRQDEPEGDLPLRHVDPGLEVPVQARPAPLAPVRLTEALHGAGPPLPRLPCPCDGVRTRRRDARSAQLDDQVGRARDGVQPRWSPALTSRSSQAGVERARESRQ